MGGVKVWLTSPPGLVSCGGDNCAPRFPQPLRAGLTCATWMNLSSTCARCAGPGRLSTMTCTQRDTLLLSPTDPSRAGQPRTEPCKT